MVEGALQITQIVFMQLIFSTRWRTHLLSWNVLTWDVAFTSVLKRVFLIRNRRSLLSCLVIILKCSSWGRFFIRKILIRIRFLKIVIKYIVILMYLKSGHILPMLIILLLIHLWSCWSIVRFHILLVEWSCLT